ncbi:Pirin-related protein [Hahella chejuensis KCTC 2396]|uniref:Pirin-related protein n=1 Tax=Hahella chejuensis (strain KCTC 2396) TaxID=349521 RepID=Q2SQE3_HAHCH|nr:pirin family protein [Hahella chejuensis]ABC27131.1 Pirin-related protein [Hahella chejuensis KCTC 2396]
MAVRELKRIINASPATDGAGVRISRIAGFSATDLEPFLMIDEIRSDERDDFIAGFPEHPHRGLETLTYMKEGGFEHRDHMGNQGAIKSGGAQWMSAGKGVIHSEMPIPEAARMHGFQIWINLPRTQKMKAPEWRDAQPEELPSIILGCGEIRVIAGSWRIQDNFSASPLNRLAQSAGLLDISLLPNGKLDLPLEPDQQAAIYVYNGRVHMGSVLQTGQLGILGEGDRLQLSADKGGADFLLLAGEALHEPVAHYGPFVMNTHDEILAAVKDYQEGKLTA